MDNIDFPVIVYVCSDKTCSSQQYIGKASNRKELEDIIVKLPYNYVVVYYRGNIIAFKKSGKIRWTI